ncbi:unnamed protein product [Urochloa humidicola]
MLNRVAVLPTSGRPSAVRRFPRGCGRHHNAAGAAGLPPRYPLPATAAATKPPLPKGSTPARAANETAPPQPGRTLPAAASSGAAGPGPGVGNDVRKAAAAVTVRRASAVRRYPPGCGRGDAASKPPASSGEAGSEAGAGKTVVAVGNRDARGRVCELEVMLLRAAAPDRPEFNSNGGVQSEEGGDAGAQEEDGGKPWVVSGPMAVPFLPWAQHGRRSQGPKA